MLGYKMKSETEETIEKFTHIIIFGSAILSVLFKKHINGCSQINLFRYMYIFILDGEKIESPT